MYLISDAPFQHRAMAGGHLFECGMFNSDVSSV